MIHRLRWPLLALLLAALPAGAAGPRNWAVVIGVDQYQNAGVTDLQYAEADARLFADALESSGAFSREELFLFTTSQGGEQAPTRTNIAFRFDYLRRHVGPGDTLVVYFSGHGMEIEGQSFLLTPEADARSLLTLQQSALHARDFFTWLAATRAGKTLLVVDACRNDPIRGRGEGDNLMGQGLARDLALVDLPGERAAAPSSATLFACSAGQRSFEWADRGHGFFTWYLVDGLRGGAASPDGTVTLASLVNYLQAQVPSATQKWALREQSPWLRYEGPGADRWVLARPGTAARVAATPQPSDDRVRQAEERARQAEEARQEAERRAREAEEARRDAEARASASGSRADASATRELLDRISSLEGSLHGGQARLVWVSTQPGAPFASVARAAAVSPPGSRIMIRPGIYQERLVIDRPLHLTGDGGEVILRSPDGGVVVEVRTTDPVVLEDLTIDGTVLGQPTLRNCRVRSAP